ncbi:hypothetical protein [Chryseobacterium sp. MP_3.2]|uniref:hypothetical protein n=1 Tax=Chryseobacterium sp. MP_3.2 TaxID=3071712 RepID=UPI002DFE9833|nr:hypothetical protein [Chryseobacterium sp. MP_3.2]
MSNLKDHLLTAAESKVFAEYYELSNYKEINSRRPVDSPDSKTYSIDLNILKEYIALIETEMHKKGIINKGIKVTMGKYPQKSDDVKIRPEYLGYQTIFFSAIDLGNIEMKTNNITSLLEDDAEDIPDMNYMNITPPF